MILTLLTPADYVTTAWSGGTTTQLAIEPAGALYADRDFLWRISSAKVELEESDFTALPDYRRFISTLRGDMTLSHNGGPALTLRPGDIHCFDGGDRTHSWGRCTDFNLMLRKGAADGSMTALRIEGETGFRPDRETECALLYCAAGSAVVRVGGEEYRLSAGESILVREISGECLWLDGAGGTLILAVQMRRVRQ
ncbi:MAG: HutD family protein [Oscillospiraceae bacterium]|nr:HutD family protein [Oscillospiraceae bacterium]